MRRLVAVGLLLAACTSPGETASTPTAAPDDCQDPPVSETRLESDLAMTVDPNPARPREQAGLTVASSGLPVGAVVGVDALWQCWDGAAWTTTHILYRGFGELDGQTIPVNDDFQIRVPDIGLTLDDAYPIVIPQVSAGTYRIQDEVLTNDSPTRGLVIVEVIAG